MAYDKKSFLAGIAVGRQMKGWSASKISLGGGSVNKIILDTDNDLQLTAADKALFLRCLDKDEPDVLEVWIKRGTYQYRLDTVSISRSSSSTLTDIWFTAKLLPGSLGNFAACTIRYLSNFYSDNPWEDSYAFFWGVTTNRLYRSNTGTIPSGMDGFWGPYYLTASTRSWDGTSSGTNKLFIQVAFHEIQTSGSLRVRSINEYYNEDTTGLYTIPLRSRTVYTA